MNTEHKKHGADGVAHLLLKKKRVLLGLTQQQVSDAASIDIRLYQRFESGERQIGRASFRIGVAVADVLELDVHELAHTPSVDAYLTMKKEYDLLRNAEEE